MAESRSITRRSLVAGSAVVPAAALAASFPGAALPSQTDTADPVLAAIDAHTKAYAACGAYQDAEPGDEVGLEPLLDAEREAADALAATVPTTLAGTAAALAYVRSLHERDNYPLLDDWGCYVFIASTETALRQVLGHRSLLEHRENGEASHTCSASPGFRCAQSGLRAA